MSNQVASAVITGLASVVATAKDVDSVATHITGVATFSIMLPVVTKFFHPPAAPPVVSAGPPLRVLPTPMLRPSLGIPTRRNG